MMIVVKEQEKDFYEQETETLVGTSHSAKQTTPTM
jgi:hypothetical protein